MGERMLVALATRMISGKRTVMNDELPRNANRTAGGNIQTNAARRSTALTTTRGGRNYTMRVKHGGNSYAAVTLLSCRAQRSEARWLA